MQKRSATTRAQILNAAERIFAHSGFDSSGVAEICQAAGVSKGAFYYHFPSKQAVFLELLQNWLAELEGHLEQVRQENQTVPQSLLQMASAMRQVFRAADGRLPMFLEFWTQASRDPTFWAATIAPYRQFQRYFSELVTQGVAQGSLKKVDPQASSRVIIALAVGMLFQGLLDPQGDDWAQVTQQGMRYLMTGLAAEAL
jgi:AcrR family transcriptional regulator